MKKKVFIILAICIILAVLIKIDKSDEIFGLSNEVMTNAFVVTYVCETNPNCYVTVYPRGGNIFCYDDGYNSVYIEGKFEKCSSNEYLITGNEIETQYIVSENKRFSFSIDNEKLNFKKISEIPIFREVIEKPEK